GSKAGATDGGSIGPDDGIPQSVEDLVMGRVERHFGKKQPLPRDDVFDLDATAVMHRAGGGAPVSVPTGGVVGLVGVLGERGRGVELIQCLDPCRGGWVYGDVLGQKVVDVGPGHEDRARAAGDTGARGTGTGTGLSAACACGSDGDPEKGQG